MDGKSGILVMSFLDLFYVASREKHGKAGGKTRRAGDG